MVGEGWGKNRTYQMKLTKIISPSGVGTILLGSFGLFAAYKGNHDESWMFGFPWLAGLLATLVGLAMLGLSIRRAVASKKKSDWIWAATGICVYWGFGVYFL